MQKYKTKIISVAIILAALTIAWGMGGGYGEGGKMPPIPPDVVARGHVPETAASIGTPVERSTYAADSTLIIDTPDLNIPASDTPIFHSLVLDEPVLHISDTPVMHVLDISSETKPEPGQPDIDHDAPDGSIPIEPQDIVVSDDMFTVTLSVKCDILLDNMNRLNIEKHELVPADGIIFPATAVTAHKGESVFNILQREMKRARIHLEFRNTPIYNSAYIMGINNIYQFDAGELSGWMYRVNGIFPNYSSSRYQLGPGDVIEWLYSLNLGRDIGADPFFGGQEDE